MVSVSQAPIFRWVVAPRPDRSAVVELAERLHLPEALAALLVQRGQGNADEARKYLRPAIGDLSDPCALAGMAEAVDAIASAVRAGGTIMVHGDYDVDGQCATAVLTRALRAAGADVVPFVPHRLRDGYDFGPAGLAAARAAGASLVVTCDCGITAVDTVRDGARGRHRRGRHRPPPARRRAAPGDRHRGPAAPRRHLGARPISAAPASPSSWSRRWCPRSASRPISPTTCSTWWRWPPWPTWCRSRARTGSW